MSPRALFAAVLLVGCTDPSLPAPARPRNVRYLALGDSFTIGTGSAPEEAFPARLVARWKAQGCNVELKNVAVNGFTTDDVLREELPAVATFHPTFVTLAIGANDIVQGKSIATYRANVERIIDEVTKSGARLVVLPQPKWSRSPTGADFGAAQDLSAAIADHDALLASEARSHGGTFIDLGPLMEKQADAALYAPDGLHPNAEAYDAWSAELARVLPSPCSP